MDLKASFRQRQRQGPMRYPAPFLDRIRQHFRLSEVVGSRVALRRSGREFSGLCPFHDEKTPSFTVNDEKAFFHCFGCGAHGDVIGFVADAEHTSYREAIEQLARQAGMELPQLDATQRRMLERSDELHQVTEAAASWFTLQLRQISGETARRYLADRGLDEETIREFRIGFAPQKRSALKDAMMQRGFAERLLVEAGLLAHHEDAPESYDKFRGRIMFPICDAGGRVIAFGGRLLDKEAKGPKYLNSPETPLFHKSRTLYRYDVARREAVRTGELLIGEGYMDVVALSQAGLAHAVAPNGTAISREQLSMAWQLVDEPILCLDGDAAGWRAMERALELALPLLTPGKSLRFVRLPPGEDPDSLLRKVGPDGLRKLLSQTVPLSEMLWKKHIASGPAGAGAATPEQAAATEQALMNAAAKIAHPAVREQYRHMMKDRLYQHRQEIRQMAFTARKVRGGNAKPAAPVSRLLTSPMAILPLAQNRDRARAECVSGLLALSYLYPELLDHGLDEALAAAEFTEANLSALRDALLACHADEKKGREAVMASLQEAGVAQAAREVADRQLPKSLRLSPEEEGAPLARLFREHLEKRLEMLHLEEEYALAEAQLARNMEERDIHRLDHLRARLKELRDHREFFPDKDALG